MTQDRIHDPDAWAKLAKLAGCRYMVLTTKHHSGFCLWPTKTTEFWAKGQPAHQHGTGTLRSDSP